MSLELMDYREQLVALAHAIRSVVGVDVIIVDQWLTQIVNTFQYTKEPQDIRVNSVVGNIIVTGKAQVAENRRDSKACLTCPGYSTCELDSVVGVPLMTKDGCAGALLLSFSAKNAALLKDHAEGLMAFLTNISELIVRSMEANELSSLLEQAQQNTAQLLEKVSDGVVLVSDDRTVRFANEKFCACFDFRPETLIGQNLEQALRPFHLNADERLRVGTSLAARDGHAVQLISSDIVAGLGGGSARMYLFRKRNVSRMLQTKRDLTDGENLRTFWGTSAQMRSAHAAAMMATRNNLPVLIEGRSKVQNYELVRQLSRYGADEHMVPVILDCGVEAATLDSILFDDVGGTSPLLWPGCRGALCLVQINHMPYYLQKKLYTFLVSQAVRDAGGNKLRIYATSDEDLTELCQIGRFSEQLRNYLLRNHIVIPNIADSEEDLRAYMTHFVDEFAQIYEKPGFTIADGFVEELMHSGLKLDYVSLREIAEYQVRTAQDGRIESLHFQTAQLPEAAPIADKDPLEGRIRMMVQQGYQKTDIATQVGISRATLYRRLKKYNIMT